MNEKQKQWAVENLKGISFEDLQDRYEKNPKYKQIVVAWGIVNSSTGIEDEIVEVEKQFSPVQVKEMTREDKLFNLLADGKKHHSAELNELVGWDWRKVVSNLNKKHPIEKSQAGKYKYYQLILE